MNQIPGTDLKVFPITLGTMTYGSPVAFDDAVKLTQYAVSRGVNLIDTANMYEGYNRYAGSAGGDAEELVGKAVRGLPHGSVAVATKVGMKVGPAPEDEGTSPAAIRKQLDRSLARLGMDCIDLYYLHRPDESVPLADILGALSAAQRADWALGLKAQCFESHANIMLHLSPDPDGRIPAPLAERFAEIGARVSFPAPLMELPAGWLRR